MLARYIGIAFSRKTGDRNFPRRFAHELVVGRHLKFGAHDRQHQTPQFGVTEKLLRRLNIEMANKLGEHIVRLCVGGKTDAEFRQLQQIVHHTFFERTLVGDAVGRSRTRPDAVAADKAYSSRANRSYLRRRGIKAVIPEKVDQAANRKKRGSTGGRPVAFDTVQYRDRNTVERCINKIKAWRGLATRYGKTPDSYMAGLQLRGSIIWIRSLHPAT